MSSLPQRICLNMIVRNEEAIIYDTLVHLYQKIPFHYWVISDTGSEDNTKEKIHQFAEEYGILGEIYDDVWEDFGHNRTLAIEHAYGKADWLLFFDADDHFVGIPQLPKQMGEGEVNSYLMQFSGENINIYYSRILLVNNRMHWKYVGVLHEQIVLNEPGKELKQALIQGDYYVVSGKHGARSKNPEKYYLDALLLEKAWDREKEEGMRARYAFYCGNSYFDYIYMNPNSPKKEECIQQSINWYTTCINDNHTWFQEKYHALYRMYVTNVQQSKMDAAIYYLVWTLTIDPSRVEGACLLMEHYLNCRNQDLAQFYYHRVRNAYLLWASNPEYQTVFRINKLFFMENIYHFYFPWLVIQIWLQSPPDISWISVMDIQHMFGVIFSKKYYHPNMSPALMQQISDAWTRASAGLTAPELGQLAVDYFASSPTPLSILVKAPPSSSAKTLLFYTGEVSIPRKWNSSLRKQYALGGSETAVIHLAMCFSEKLPNWKIWVYGASVMPEQFQNLFFVNQLPENQQYDWVIVSRYLDFFQKYTHLLRPNGKSILMAHDTLFRPPLPDPKEAHTVVTLTPWHQSCLQSLYTSSHPNWEWKIINNGVPKLLINPQYSPKRIPFSFVFTSRPERGLDALLTMWPKIREFFPEAQLFLAGYTYPDLPLHEWTPKNAEISEDLLNKIKQCGKEVHVLGALSPTLLYELLFQMEIWYFPSKFAETSCISAMEMLLTGVACFYYPIAGLVDTLQGHGFPMKVGQEMLGLLDYYRKSETEHRIWREKGQAFASQQTWESRSNQWIELLSL